jgi:hypothetical protein
MMWITVTFMTILEAFMQRFGMGFTMAGSTFLNYLMSSFMAVHALQFSVFTYITFLGVELISMAASTEFR